MHLRRPRAATLPLVTVLLLGLLASACSFTERVDVQVSRPQAQSSRVYANDGTLIATLHGEEDRESVDLALMPQSLRDAVVAVEDDRFWEHRGVDLRAVVRAAYANTKEGRIAEGGSTITQQYVKNVLLAREKTARRKLREAALAYQLEQRYTKARILELYLNSIYFGNGAYGVQAAAQSYFDADVKSLDLGQSALLAGMIQSPNTTDPYENLSGAMARRRIVLDRMVEQGRVTAAAADGAADAAVKLRDRSTDQRYPAAYFVERVKRFVLDDERFGPTPAARRDLLFRGGLRINTTIDLARQAEAEDAMNKVLSKPDTDPAGALVSLEPRTGKVRALVGGHDFFGSAQEAKFDLATQGRRPAGSAFKPFVLAAALKEGIPLSRVYDAPSRMTLRPPTGIWHVDNYEGGGGGRLDLVDATVNSVNTVYAQLILDVGVEDAVGLATDLGITSPLKALPSAVLGTNDVSPLEMASAYGTLANRGLAVKPVFVTKVLGARGEVLFEHHHAQRRVLPAPVADNVVAVMRQVIERGTAVAARIGRPVAGKTGTGQAWRDAWFVGFTPELATSVWVGFPERQKSMVPPATRIRVTGGSWPAQAWQLYMTKALADVPASDFAAPPPLVASTTTTIPGPSTTTIPEGAVVLPNVVGAPEDEAAAILFRVGLQVARTRVKDDQYPPGYVVATTPRAGSIMRSNDRVTLIVADGPNNARVPEIVGLTEEEARDKVVAAGLEPRVILESEPDSPGAAERRGRVWKQAPAAGTGVDRGSAVAMWVNPR